MVYRMHATDIPPMKLDQSTRQLLRDPEKRKHWAIYQFGLRGRSLASVAREVGIKKDTLYVVWSRPYPRMERVLAELLGITPQEMFPDRYDAAGKPARRIGRPPKKSASNKAKNNSRATPCNDKANEAA